MPNQSPASPQPKIEVSATSIIKVLIILAGLYILYLIRNIVFILLIVFILDAAFGPIVDHLENKKIPRWTGAMIVYLLILGVLTGFAFLIIPPLVNQIGSIADNLPQIIERLSPIYQWFSDLSYGQSLIAITQESLQNLSGQISNIASNIITTTLGVFAGILATLIIAVLLFYLLLERNSFAKSVVYFLPKEKEDKYLEIASKISTKWGAWFRGQILVALVMGFTAWVGLTIIGVPYALTLAILVAFTEFIPVIGPYIGGIPAVLVGLSVNPWIGLIVTIFYIVIQQLENYLLVPKIMQQAIGLPPVIIVVAILVAGQLFGLIGVILAIPITAGLMVLVREWKSSKHEIGK